MTAGSALFEEARKLFAGPCDFVAGTDTLIRLPPTELPEIAFAGRSNVGKSSLINALTGRKTLARVSDTPGRTQQLNFFNLGDRLLLVDMPGHGYAKVSKMMKASWQELIRDYLRGRPTLRAVLLLADSRHGLKKEDVELLSLLDGCAVSCRVIFTKTDKASPEELKSVLQDTEGELKKHACAFPSVALTSAHDGVGIGDLRAVILGLSG